jgi:hypothetical protein
MNFLADETAEEENWNQQGKQKKQSEKQNIDETALEKGKFARSRSEMRRSLMTDDVLDPVDGPV